MTSIAVADQPSLPTSRRPTWALVIDHVEARWPALPRSAVVDFVIADMRARDGADRARYGEPLSETGRDHLIDAYQTALDFAVDLANELVEHGAALDAPINVRAPRSSHLVRVQSMLWDHVRTIVQLRGLIEERAS